MDSFDIYLAGQQWSSHRRALKYTPMDPIFRLNVSKLLEMICEDYGIDRDQLVVSVYGDREKSPFFRALKSNFPTIRLPLCRGDNVDTQLAVDLTEQVTGGRGEVERVVVLSGSGCIVPSLEKAVHCGVPVSVWTWRDSVAPSIVEMSSQNMIGLKFLDLMADRFTFLALKHRDRSIPTRRTIYIRLPKMCMTMEDDTEEEGDSEDGNSDFLLDRSERTVLFNAVAQACTDVTHIAAQWILLQCGDDQLLPVCFAFNYRVQSKVLDDVVESLRGGAFLEALRERGVTMEDGDVEIRRCSGIQRGFEKKKSTRPPRISAAAEKCRYGWNCFHGLECSYRHTAKELEYFTKYSASSARKTRMCQFGSRCVFVRENRMHDCSFAHARDPQAYCVFCHKHGHISAEHKTSR